MTTLRTCLLSVSAILVCSAILSPGLSPTEAGQPSGATGQKDTPSPETPIALGSRRELLVDTFLIDTMADVTLKMHTPEARDVALVCDVPWEGNTSAYFTIFEDDGLIRAYYRGAHYDETTKKATHPEVTCYAESRDGITFTRPRLGLFEYEGSKDNNIILSGSEGTHNFAPFKDAHPNCRPEARYKALARDIIPVNGKRKSVLIAWQSPDGIHWSKMREEPVIINGAFDSQNIAFYDPQIGAYRAYWRYFGGQPRTRAIRTATSQDFLTWEHEADLTYGDSPSEHLYTNAIQPLPGAPHLLIGFPTRFQPSNEQVEPVFMSSRDGVAFRRWPEPLIPITAPEDRDGNRSNYMAYGLVSLSAHPREVSVYGTEAYYAGPGSRIRRFAFRKDGFISASTAGQGEVVTKPLTFDGTELHLNLRSQGMTRAELQDAAGQPLPGFALADCQPLQADETDLVVRWSGGSLAPLSGRPVRLRLVLDRADLFALQFRAAP